MSRLSRITGIIAKKYAPSLDSFYKTQLSEPRAWFVATSTYLGALSALPLSDRYIISCNDYFPLWYLSLIPMMPICGIVSYTVSNEIAKYPSAYIPAIIVLYGVYHLTSSKQDNQNCQVDSKNLQDDGNPKMKRLFSPLFFPKCRTSISIYYTNQNETKQYFDENCNFTSMKLKELIDSKKTEAYPLVDLSISSQRLWNKKLLFQGNKLSPEEADKELETANRNHF